MMWRHQSDRTKQSQHICDFLDEAQRKSADPLQQDYTHNVLKGLHPSYSQPIQPNLCSQNLKWAE